MVERFKYGNAALHMCLPAQGKLSQPTPFYTFLDMACLYIERWGEACNNVLWSCPPPHSPADAIAFKACWTLHKNTERYYMPSPRTHLVEGVQSRARFTCNPFVWRGQHVKHPMMFRNKEHALKHSFTQHHTSGEHLRVTSNTILLLPSELLSRYIQHAIGV